MNISKVILMVELPGVYGNSRKSIIFDLANNPVEEVNKIKAELDRFIAYQGNKIDKATDSKTDI